MHKILSKIILSFSLLLFLLPSSGCSKRPINGWLDGQWEVMQVDPAPLPELSNERFFYNFGMHICQLYLYNQHFIDGIMAYDGETISVNFPHELTSEEIETLRYFGIDSNPFVFNVDFPNKNTLILSNDDTTVVLRRF